MGTRKKSSELVFNLQWRNKPDNGGDKSNVIGMYDTPTTTSNFEMFKSYLLKNSGVAGNDVKVTYLTDNGQEWVIDSQEWFEIALSSFRLKARLGEVIFLKLDKISSGRHQMTRKHSNDVETQSDVDSMGHSVVAPPEWFVAYMKQFKRDIVEEVTFSVNSNVSAASNNRESVPVSKFPKKTRKHLVLGETPIDKDLLKTLRFDRKLENKLDKLDAKTKKIKEKKQALISKIENDEQKYVGKFSFVPMGDDDNNASALPVTDKKPVLETKESEIPIDVDGTPLLNASLVNADNSVSCARMMGGEVYLHTWKVVNSGKLSWSSNTELRLTWGSTDLIPSVKSLRCPCLKSGEQGTISVCFEIPKNPGTYESYWNFYDKKMRFGHTLNCCVIVEEPFSTMSTNKLFKKPRLPVFSQKTKIGAPIEKVERAAPCMSKPDEPRKEHKVKEENEQIGRVLIYSNGVEGESKPFTIPISKGTKKVMFFPNGIGDDAEPFEIPLPKNFKEEQKDAQFENLLIYPEGITQESKPDYVKVPKNSEVHIAYGLQNKSKTLKLQVKRSSPSTESSPEKQIQMQFVRPKEEKPFQPNTSTCIFFPHGVGNPNGAGKQIDANSGNVLELSTGEMTPNLIETPNNLKHYVSEENFCMVQATEELKESAACLSSSVMDLSRRIEDIKLVGPPHGDSDSDWESVWSYSKSRLSEENLTTDFASHQSNKYGIQEKDLIVDLSTNTKEVKPEQTENVESGEKDNKENELANRSEDNNNNTSGTLDNNNSSGESISEIASEASDLSSGYDVLQVPLCDEQDDGLGYVYITIDGNKVPVPKHILRPDFLTNAEEAPAPVTDDEKPVETKVAPKENVEPATPTAIVEPQVSDQKQNIEEQNPLPPADFLSHCSAVGSTFSDITSGRLFIFPQNHPGYEVVETTSNEQTAPLDQAPVYTCPISESDRYMMYNGRYLSHLKSDPYGPLDHSHSSSSSHSTPTPAPEHPRNNPPFDPYVMDCGGFSPNPNWSQYRHVPNLQQSGPKPFPLPTMTEAPSAPPQPQPAPEQSPGRNVPVHILPENLVSGAVNVASSAINTARSVINMIVPPKTEPGRWVNGHWVTENQESIRAKNLCILAEMGFWDADLNATLLARYNDDIARVVSELIQ